jgi:predicted transcriptional regulator
MTTAELKSFLHEKIDKIEDEEYLEDLAEMLNDSLQADIKLEQWEIERIEESEKQIERGEFYTEDEANKLVDKWFEGK